MRSSAISCFIEPFTNCCCTAALSACHTLLPLVPNPSNLFCILYSTNQRHVSNMIKFCNEPLEIVNGIGIGLHLSRQGGASPQSRTLSTPPRLTSRSQKESSSL